MEKTLTKWSLRLQKICCMNHIPTSQFCNDESLCWKAWRYSTRKLHYIQQFLWVTKEKLVMSLYTSEYDRITHKEIRDNPDEEILPKRKINEISWFKE